MTEQQALLAAICSQPEDDTVRLVYADWLDENGQPEREEFIRVQIEIAKTHLSIGPASAYSLAASTEMRNYLMQSPQAIRDVVDNENDCRWHGLPPTAFGVPVRIDPTILGDPIPFELFRRMAYSLNRDLAPLKDREVELWTERCQDNYARGFHWFTAPVGFSMVLNEYAARNFFNYGFGVVRRGFVSTLRLSWEEWSRHHAKLAWHRKHRDYDCPLTAQPIEEVKLTTMPDQSDFRQPMGIYSASIPGSRWTFSPLLSCEDRWSWIKFVLPNMQDIMGTRPANEPRSPPTSRT